MARKEPKYTNLPAKELPPYQLYKRWQKATGYSSMDRFGSLPREEALKAIGEASGKGWRENPDHTGKAPKHRKAALKAEGKGAINEPIRTGRAQAKHAQNTPTKKMINKAITERNKWIASTLLNDEASTGTQMVEYFMTNGLSREDAEFYVSQRSDARRDPLGFRLKLKTKHRKLTEKERDRMVDMWASAPLDYRPDIDDELMKLGLAQFWDNMPDAVENTDMPFYAHNGGILPEWYDFKAETARYEAERASKYTPPYRVDVWEERDRLIITVYDSKDKEVASWVDEEAREMFENGFFDSKDVEESVLGYLTDIGTIRR